MLHTERNGAVLVATLSRPPVNAMNAELIVALHAALDTACGDDRIRLLHIRSDCKVFCAGADLALMQACFASDEGMEAMIGVVREMQRLFARLESAPVVTLAELGGAALGGGFELALGCDLRVAAAEAKIGLPEAKLGLLPGAGGTQRLTRLVGPALAKRLILGAEVVDGATAQSLGLVQWSQPRAELAAWTRALAARFAEIPKTTLVLNKQCIGAAIDPSRDGFADEIDATRALYRNPESRALVAAFLEGSAKR